MFVNIVNSAAKVSPNIGITNGGGGGYFGDHALHYIKTKWLAYKYNIPFYFEPFVYSNQLNLIKHETIYTAAERAKFSKKVVVRHESEILNNLKNGNILWFMVWSPGYGFNTEDIVNFLSLHAPNEFVKSLRLLMQPLNPPELIKLPNNYISVAVHIRKPVATDDPLFSMQEFDSSIYNTSYNVFDLNLRCISDVNLYSRGGYADINSNALKFPPNQFYIDQIKKISTYLHDVPIYLHIFTSDPNPQKLCDSIRRGVAKSNITFGIPQFSAHGTVNIIEDCYQMSKFDCLIKSISSFSTISQIMGEHALIIYPTDYLWDYTDKNNTKLVITKTAWLVRSTKLANLLKKF